jgi:hypothetical protein
VTGPPQPPPVRVACPHCHGTGVIPRPVKRRGECTAVWWDLSTEPYTQWTCGRPLLPGQTRYCNEHERQAAWAEQRGEP